MAKLFPKLALAHRDFIAAQHLFFVATAAATGRVNTSPKGMDSLRVLSPNRILWLNSTGSGNETTGHIAQVNRMTLMWCSFGAQPLILRAYGTARAIHQGDADWAECIALFPHDPAARQVFDMAVDLVQTSCGYGVPQMSYDGERDDAARWVAEKGPEGIRAYWAEKNSATLDGFATGFEANLEPR
jgi:Pyridoxamine 5'-phosphate oxidase